MDRKSILENIKIYLFMVCVGILVITAINWINGDQDVNISHVTYGSTHIIQDMQKNQLTWNDIILRDDTIYNQNGSCQASYNGMEVFFPECDAKTMSGIDINQEAIFNTNRTEGTTYWFVYQGRLERARLYLWRNYSHTYSEKTIEDYWINNYLVDNVINYVDLGSPSDYCDFGSIHNNMSYNVTKMTKWGFNVTYKYCFSSRQLINTTTFRISGNATREVTDQVTGYKYDWDDISNIVEDVTDNVPSQLRKTFTFYKIDDVSVGNYKVKWIFTPKNNATSGKFHILAYPTSKGIAQAYNDGDYMYQDPTWNSSFTNGLKYYWNMDEGAGTKAVDLISWNNLTFTTGENWTASGLINNGTQFDTKRNMDSATTIAITGANPFTVSLWINTGVTTNEPAGQDRLIFSWGTWSAKASIGAYFQQNTNQLYYLNLFDDSAITGVTKQGKWQHIVLVYNGTGLNVYSNGTFILGKNMALVLGSTNKLRIAGRPAGQGDGNNTFGYDEFGIWNRSLSAGEISDLYNNGLGMTYSNGTASSTYILSVAQTFPPLSYKTNLTTLTFNWTVTIFNATATNYTLTVDYMNSSNYYTLRNTSLSLTSNFSVSHTASPFPEQNYSWNIEVCGTLGNGSSYCSRGSALSFRVHTTPPQFSLITLNNLTTLTLPVNATFNVTTIDSELDTCMYSTSENIALKKYNCGQLTNATFNSGGDKNITIWANDTFGNSNQTAYFVRIYSFNVTQYENADPIAEGSQSVIYLYVNSTAFPIGDATANITWNGTIYAPTSKTALGLDTILFGYAFSVTAGMGNSTGKIYSYNWTYNTTQLSTRSTPITTQTIISFGIDDCTVYGVQIANISLKDEESASYLYGLNSSTTKLEIETLTTSTTYPDVTWSFAKTWNNITSVRLCVPNGVLNNSNFTLDMTMGFEGTDHVREFYFLDNGTLRSNYCGFNEYTSCNISLYDLATADSTTFLFEFTDENNQEVEDAIVHTFRKYIGEGLFREVERSRDDDNGQTHVHLVEEDVIYYFQVSQYGRILYTSNTYNAKCLATPCTITLSASPSATNWTVVDNEGGLYTVTSNKTSRTASVTFSLTTPATVNATLYRYNGGRVQILNSTQTYSTGGTVSLPVPIAYGNETFFVAIYKNGEFVKSSWADLSTSGRDYFGTSGAIYGGLIVLAIFLMAVSEGVALILFGSVVLILITIMALVELQWLAIISLITAGGIIVWKLMKRRRSA